MSKKEEKITLINEVKNFGINELGISDNPSFTQFADMTKFFVVYASKKDEIKSVLGKYGNNTFDNPKECQELEDKLKRKGHDTLQMTWEACGIVDCPITSAMINASKTRLTYLVLHENWHIHSRLNKINFPLCIEEAIGDCFAKRGALLFHSSNPQMQAQIKKDFEEWQQFFAFANKYLPMLNEAYTNDFSQAREMLKNAKQEADELVKDITSKEIKQRFQLPINNAFFLRASYYAPYVTPVYERLKDVHPREYTTDTKLLRKLLKGIK